MGILPFTIGFVLAVETGCHSGNSSSTNGKVILPDQRAQPVATPRVQPSVQPAQTAAPDVAPPNGIHNVVPATPAPTPPGTSQVPTLPPQPPPGANDIGSLHFKAVTFVNMEHQAHATEPGSWAILKSGSQVVAAGPMLVEAACRGENVDSMAYPVVRLNVGLRYVSSAIQAGQMSGSQQGTLSVCIVNDARANGDALSCQHVDRGTDADRPAFWYDVPVSFSISANNDISVETSAGYSDGGGGGGGGGDGLALNDQKKMRTGDPYDPSRNKKGGGFKLAGSENVSGGLSFAHPIQAPICGSAARSFADYNSPLVVDMSGSGEYDLINVWDARKIVHFDITGTGKKLRTGWVGPKAGLLAFDVNGNGMIDNATELFGEYAASIGEHEKGAFTNFKNGFAALAQYDANEDGVIDEHDPIYSKLVVWIDRNGDGLSQPDELLSLKKAGIKSISLAYQKVGQVQPYFMVKMNEVKLESTYTTFGGAVRKIADVWFAARHQELSQNETGDRP